MSECIAQQEEIVHQENIKHISWDDLDKRKYYTIGPTIMLGVRILVYPPMLIKTRIQVQKHKSSYNGTLDAFRKIYKYEGVRGFYKGFGTSTLSMFSGQIYITTFEVIREKAPTSEAYKSLIAGTIASLAGQTLTVPIDIISQKQMMYGQEVSKDKSKPKIASAYAVGQNIYRKYGLRGFYKGYVASILTYTPNSGIWWAAYYKFTQFYGNLRPEGTPDLVVQGLSGPSAAMVASWLTNPNDIVRTRLQVSMK